MDRFSFTAPVEATDIRQNRLGGMGAWPLPVVGRTVSSGALNGVTAGRHFGYLRFGDRRKGEIVRDEPLAGPADGKTAANYPGPKNDPKVVQPDAAQGFFPRPAPPTGELSRREDRVTLELHRAVATKLLDDPAAVLSVVPENIARLRRQVQGASAESWLTEWAALTQTGDTAPLIARMLGGDSRSIAMRQVSPFNGVLTQEERLEAIYRASTSAQNGMDFAAWAKMMRQRLSGPEDGADRGAGENP